MLLRNGHATLEIWFFFYWKHWKDFPLLVISVFLSDLQRWLTKVFGYLGQKTYYDVYIVCAV